MSRRALTPAQRVAVKIRRSVPHLIIALVNVCAIPFVHAADDADAFFDRINAKFSSNQTYTFTALHKRIARNTTNAQTASLNIVSVNYGLGLGRKTIVPLDSPENDQGYIWNNGTITYLSPMRDFFAPPHSSPPLSSRVCERTIGAFQLPELKTLFQLHYKSAGQFLPGSNICAAGTSEIKTLVATRTNGTLTLCIDTARNVILRSLFEGGTPRRVTVEFSQFRQVNGHWIPFKYVIEALPPASIETFELLELSTNSSFDKTLLEYKIPPDTMVSDARFVAHLSYHQGFHEYSDAELAALADKIRNGERPRIGRDAERGKAAPPSRLN